MAFPFYIYFYFQLKMLACELVYVVCVGVGYVLSACLVGGCCDMIDFLTKNLWISY